MLYRKIQEWLPDYFRPGASRMLLLTGARRTGKTCAIRQAAQARFANYIELDLRAQAARFAAVRTTEDFYLRLSMLAGDKMKTKAETLVFFDEITAAPNLLALLPQLRREDRFTYVAAAAQPPAALPEDVTLRRLYPLDFEEFLRANEFSAFAVEMLRKKLERLQPLDEASHEQLLDWFKKYLLVGGLPEAVETYVRDKNIVAVRARQREIHELLAAEAAAFDAAHRRRAARLYELIPAAMQSRKKRIMIRDIEQRSGTRAASYQAEFDWLAASGLTLCARAVAEPRCPLADGGKNLRKLYWNDVGLLSGALYENNVQAVLDDEKSPALGALYETAVAAELAAHGYDLYYYDNREHGAIDFLLEMERSRSVAPVQVRSGRDYSVFSALPYALTAGAPAGYVLSNRRIPQRRDGVVQLPVYSVMFL